MAERGHRPSGSAVLWTAAAASACVLLAGLVLGPGLDNLLSRPAGVAVGLQHGAPPPAGYFVIRPVGAWRRLPGDTSCEKRVQRSPWEPRPDNYVPNHTRADVGLVREAFRLRPRAVQGAYDPRWDSWLLARVSGRHVGTTDENIQWAACKWGLPDNFLRAMAIRESDWRQHAVYNSGRCVELSGCGDLLPPGTEGAARYCTSLARWGRDYQLDYGQGRCPKTFSIIGVAAWHHPDWGRLRGNQNGTFPFSRNSTAFALDYAGAFLRGCFEGWVTWLGNEGSYRAGDLWGCAGAWYSGAWRTPAARQYIAKVSETLRQRTWLSPDWARHELPCSSDWGCPRGASPTDLAP